MGRSARRNRNRRRHRTGRRQASVALVVNYLNALPDEVKEVIQSYVRFTPAFLADVSNCTSAITTFAYVATATCPRGTSAASAWQMSHVVFWCIFDSASPPPFKLCRPGSLPYYIRTHPWSLQVPPKTSNVPRHLPHHPREKGTKKHTSPRAPSRPYKSGVSKSPDMPRDFKMNF